MVAAHELRDIASRPGPFIGGVVGSLLGCAAIVAAMLWMSTPAAAEPEPVLVIEFLPASLLAAAELDGEPSEAEPSDAESDPVEAASEDPGATVSDSLASSSPHHSVMDPSPTVEPTPTPKPTPKPSPQPTPAPAPKPAPKSPFTTPGAWSDMIADGDPWAAAVMRALRSMKIPAWAGKLSADKPFGFRLRICKDGRVDRVLRKQSTGDADLDATLEHEITRVDLPPIPASVAGTMAQPCMVLNYEFTWLPGGVR